MVAPGPGASPPGTPAETGRGRGATRGRGDRGPSALRGDEAALTPQRWWLHAAVNPLNAARPFTLKWQVLSYVNFTPAKNNCFLKVTHEGLPVRGPHVPTPWRWSKAVRAGLLWGAPWRWEWASTLGPMQELLGVPRRKGSGTSFGIQHCQYTSPGLRRPEGAPPEGREGPRHQPPHPQDPSRAAGSTLLGRGPGREERRCRRHLPWTLSSPRSQPDVMGCARVSCLTVIQRSAGADSC